MSTNQILNVKQVSLYSKPTLNCKEKSILLHLFNWFFIIIILKDTSIKCSNSLLKVLQLHRKVLHELVTPLVVYCVVLNTEFGKPYDSLIWFYFQTFVKIYFMHILNTLLLPDTVMKMTAGDRWKPVRD